MISAKSPNCFKGRYWTGIVSLLGLRTAAAEDSTSGGTPTTATQQPVAPRTDPVPLVDARFPCEIAEDIWIIPDRRVFLVPNIGIVVGKKAALVIDCGLGPQCGKQVIEDAERELLADAEVVPATDTYDGDRETLDLGGRQVEFHAIGTAHSPGDQMIWLPKEKILFAGDLIEERMFPIVPFLPPAITKADIDVAKWVEALSYINDEMRPSIIAPGHGNLGQAEIAGALLVYFTDVQMRVSKLADGGNIDTIVSELKPQIKTTYSTWEHDRFIEPAIRYFAQA